MDITNMLNSKGAAAAAAANSETDQQLHQLSHPNGHMADHPSRDHSPNGRPTGQMNGMNGAPNGLHYPSPPGMPGTMQVLPGFRQEGDFDNKMMAGMARQADGAQKAFPCNTCGKGFARRSDLARHERIHSGIRPHVCDYPNCNKQFIQRSALTVHTRVHTGEKPHMCERCGKPFSDSSSLARHRRIHSGKRPYKCPYADCQKTFTRRTTLTRHQNHHTGTVEEAAAATAAALAARTSGSRPRQVRSDGEQGSTTGSPMSTPSPGARTMSMSPNSELAPLNVSRQAGDYQAFLSNMAASLPVHMRSEYVTSQAPPTTTAAYSTGGRPTSHPNPYGPPQVLEPPTNMDSRSTGSVSGSPHMSSVGWQSPSHMPSPSQGNNYVYPDPDPYGSSSAMSHMYYPNSNIRRPQSTEPDAYEAKPRLNELWAGAQ